MTPERDLVGEIAKGLPFTFFSKDARGWGISWELPSAMKPYISKIACASKVQKAIVDKCQAAMNTGQLDCDRAELKFDSNSFAVTISSNEDCTLSFAFDGECNNGHNVFSSSHAYALMILFQIALWQIYDICVLWVDDPQFCLEGEPVRREYVVTRPDSTKPLHLWEAVLDHYRIGVFLARGWDKAKQKGALISEDGDVKPIRFEDVQLNGLLSFKVEVNLEGTSDHYIIKEITVLAYDEDQAESLVWESYKPTAISQVLSVKVMGEGKPLSPCILSIA